MPKGQENAVIKIIRQFGGILAFPGKAIVNIIRKGKKNG